MSDEQKPKPQPGPPSYCSMAGMPWVTSQMWFDALSGGKLNMTMLTEPAAAIPLPLLKSYKLHDVRMAPHGLPLNPSLFLHKGELHANVRVCSHELGHKVTQNFMGPVRDASLCDAVHLQDQTKTDYEYGFEDMRLFEWRGGLYGIAAASTKGTTGSPRTGQCLVRIQDGVITDAHHISSKRHEKNWMPCVDGDVLRLVYATDPLIVLVYRDGEVSPKVDNLPDMASAIRGGSPLVPYKDGWLAVVHQIHAVAGAQEKAVYVHRFAFYDRDLRAVRLSDPFFFQPGVEFCAGLIHHEGRWHLGMGVKDVEAWVLEVSDATVDALVDGSLETPKIAIKSTGGNVLRNPGARVAAPPRGTPVAGAPAAAKGRSGIVGEPSADAVAPAWNPMLGGFPPNGHK